MLSIFDVRSHMTARKTHLCELTHHVQIQVLVCGPMGIIDAK